MDLINYIGLKVKIILTNDYYYIGQVTSADENSIDLIDMKNQKVSLTKQSILTIQEVSSNGH
jgi:hypothetical protein